MSSSPVSPHDHHHDGHVHDASSYVSIRDDVALTAPATTDAGPPSSSSSSGASSPTPPSESRVAVRKLLLVTGIALVFMLMEFVGGYIAGSLAVISDAVHMLTDILGFAISLLAIWIGRKPPSKRLSFGFHRVEIVGALVSILVIWVLTGVLIYSAIYRFSDFLQDNAAEVVDGKTMFIVALLGLFINIVMMQVLGADGHGHSHGLGGHGHSHSHGDNGAHTQEETHEHSHGHGHGHGHSHDHNDAKHTVEDGSHDHDHSATHADSCTQQADELERGVAGGACDGSETTTTTKEPKKSWMRTFFSAKFENLNIQAAYLHVIGDLLQSVGVTVAGALIWYNPSWQLADPIMTFVFSILVVATTVRTVQESVTVLMEGSPRGIEVANIEKGLAACASVQGVHDLHIWSLSTNKPALAVHLVSTQPRTTLSAAQNFLIANGITHTTIQIEDPSEQYPQGCADANGGCS